MASYEKGRGGFVQKKVRRGNKPANTKALPKETAIVLGEISEREVPSFADMNVEDPVFACFLIDSSGSMSPYKTDVINAHPEMLDTLRKSAKCKNDALYVIQYTFAQTSIRLHPFEKLSANKQDNISTLGSHNYHPDGDTSLYDAVFDLLKEMAVCIEQAYEDGVKSTFTIAVITDGEDNRSKINPADVCKVIADMRSKGYLRSSVVLGLKSAQFTEQHLNDIKNKLCFDKAIPLDRDPKSIRRAFVLASQSSIT